MRGLKQPLIYLKIGIFRLISRKIQLVLIFYGGADD